MQHWIGTFTNYSSAFIKNYPFLIKADIFFIHMIKSNSHTNGVKGITYLAQTINPEIGSYQEHFINGDYDFTVKLSNGKIDMSIEIAQDYEARPSSVTYDRYETVADTFRETE